MTPLAAFWFGLSWFMVGFLAALLLWSVFQKYGPG